MTRRSLKIGFLGITVTDAPWWRDPRVAIGLYYAYLIAGQVLDFKNLLFEFILMADFLAAAFIFSAFLLHIAFRGVQPSKS